MTLLHAAAGPGRGMLLPLLASVVFHGILLSLPAVLAVPAPQTEEAPLMELSLAQAPESGNPAGQAIESPPASPSVPAHDALPPPAPVAASLPAADRTA